MGLFNSFAGNRAKSVEAEQRLSHLLSGEREKSGQLADLKRNSASLKAVTSRVMIADADNIIVSVNDSALQMMREAEADLRRVLPEFSADRLVGSSIDVFHKNPAHQQAMLEKLREPHHGRIAVGERTFDLIATPIFSEAGERTGTVVEWQDVSARLAAEKEEKARVEQARTAAAENRRIRQALDTVTSNVMMADADNIIIYTNDAVMEMLRNAEQDLKRDLPHFSADNILNNSVDVFHANPEHQRLMLERLRAPYKTSIKVGGHTFSLIATPVFDTNGERLGTVVEWQDNTEELKKFEELVKSAIGAASGGRLDFRLELAGLDGVMADFASGFNNLMEIFDGVTADAAATVKNMANGDLTRHMKADCEGRFAELKQDINSTIDRLVEVMREIQESSLSVRTGADEIAVGNMNLSQRTEQQAASLEETSSAMEQVTATVHQNAQNASQAKTLSTSAREAAESGGKVVGDAVRAMQGISESSKKINDIITVIDDIAFQTNLLALNAAVEAARAGEQGKGFAVVADEVRNLAGRSAVAAKEIKELIKDSTNKVRDGAELVNRSGDTLGTIVNSVKKVNDIVAEIATASDEQASSLDEVNRAVTDMDNATQQNAALVEEAAAASESLNGQAEKLEELISFFRIGNELHGSAASASVSKPKPATAAAPARKPAASVPAKAGAVARKPAASTSAKAATAARPPARTEPAPAPVKKSAAKAKAEDDMNWSEF